MRIGCLQYVQKISFFRNQNLPNEKKEDQKRYLEIIKEYTTLLKRYFPTQYKDFWNPDQITEVDSCNSIKNKSKEFKTKKCHFCDGKEDNFVLSDNNILCINCGTLVDYDTDNLISFRDISRINIASKYQYDRKAHFKECIRRYQGKQNINIADEVLEKIIIQLKNYNLIPSGYRAKDNDNLEKQTLFRNVTRQHIITIMKDLSLSKYYEDVNYIFHIITGHPIPNITKLEPLLLSDFDVLLEAYDRLFRDRKNFLNNQYCLYQLLQRHGHECEKSYFNILKTFEKQIYHDSVCQKLFFSLGWNFKPIF